MKTKNKTFLLFGALYINLVVCIAGSIFGTYAWYQYSSRAGVTYDGTAVGANASIEIGLYSDFDIPELVSKYGLEKDINSVHNGYVYWSTGELDSETLSFYEGKLGYSSKNVGPCSSGKYNDGDEFFLKRSPVYRMHGEELKAAYKTNYTFIQFAFRINGGNNLILTKSDLECDNNIGSSLRIEFEDPQRNGTSIIYNPTSYESGFTNVGGILDLDRNGYYDYDGFPLKEILYGQLKNSHLSDKNIDDGSYIPTEDLTTFNANHYPGVYSWDYTPEISHYLGIEDMLGDKIISSVYGSDKVIRVNASIYLEGWDLSCIDLNVDVSYNLKLEFATN